MEGVQPSRDGEVAIVLVASAQEEEERKERSSVAEREANQ